MKDVTRRGQPSSIESALLLRRCIRAVTHAHAADELPSWNDGPAKQSIVAFVERVTSEGSPDFVPVPERIAVFDNDGTLWAEQPMYFQLLFALDRVKALAPQHPEWKIAGTLCLIAEGRRQGGARGRRTGYHGDHHGHPCRHDHRRSSTRSSATGSPAPSIRRPAGSTPRWSTSRCWSCWPICGPTISRRSSSPAVASISCVRGRRRSMAYRPSRSSAAAARPASKCATASRCSCVCRKSTSSTTRPASPSASTSISAAGRLRPSATPTATFRCCNGRPLEGARFALIVHHTDAEREWAYDRKSHIGRLDKGLDEAQAKGWTVVDMKDDWKVIYALPR